MKIVNAGYEIYSFLDGDNILKFLEMCARTCYQSEDFTKEGSAERIVRRLIESGHEAMLEHYSFTVKFTVDRGVSHEIVRHRVASFAQESTRYCNYSNGKFGSEITVVKPPFWDEGSIQYKRWAESCEEDEAAYMELLESGSTPQEARSILPTSLKTTLIMTANLREWRHFFKLRAEGSTGAPHPQMLEVAESLLEDVKKIIPVIFDDINSWSDNHAAAA